jgi:hypothetical protein
LNDNKLAIITPLVILFMLIGFAQVVILPHWTIDHKFPAGGSGTSDLLMLGYNYNRDLATLSFTLWDKGSTATNITGVSYDGSSLIMGNVGSPTDLTSANNTVSANEIVFPAANHWNMFTGGPTTPVMEPSSIATFYLGIGQTSAGPSHTLTVTSATLSYTFQVPN